MVFFFWMFRFFGKNTAKTLDKTPEIFNLGKDTSKTTVLLIAGTHGNEPAGAEYLTTLVERFQTKKIDCDIKVIVIPKVNKLGLIQNIRKVPDTTAWDLNRAYPKPGHQEVREIIKTYLHLIDHADLVVDLHEAHRYRISDSRTKGSGIYSNGVGNSSTIVQKMVQNVNKIIDNQDHHFMTEQIKPIPGSLRYYCIKHKIPYILIETTHIEPLPTRLEKLHNIITTLFVFIRHKGISIK